MANSISKILPEAKKIRLTLEYCGKSVEVGKGITGRQLLGQYPADEQAVALYVNNEILPLVRPIDISADVRPVRLNSSEGAAIYRRSLCFVLAAAAHSLFPSRSLLVGHSLGYGYYYTFSDGVPATQEEVSALKEKMRFLIEENVPIALEYISYAEAVALFEEMGLAHTRMQLDFICPPRVCVNVMRGFSDMYFGPLVDSTGLLGVFDLEPYHDGFMLRFPAHKDHSKIPEFSDSPKLFSIYQAYKQWGRQLDVTSAASLNRLVHDRKIKDFINITETLQTKCMADIASKILDRPQTRVVLIAGPSSSGKTTTSYKMALQLQAIGFTPKVISLDNYYVGRDVNPKDEFGNYDYECLEALDIPLLNQNLIDLFDGKEVAIPSYNFDSGTRFYSGNKMRLAGNDILIMEGIHGLNDRLTPLIPKEMKFKIYISALTQLNLDDHNRIPTSDNRLIRRIVRDNNFRGKTAAATIAMWENVQKGERLHIFPFQDNADAMLNTALDYELPVLKVYAEPLLRCVRPTEPEYAEACRLLRFLGNFYPIPAASVPKQSIIREFIGGSDFKY